MIEVVGIALGIFGLLFAFEAPRRWFLGLIGLTSVMERRARAAGITELQARILCVLAEPHRDIVRSDYIALRLKTHEFSIRHSGEQLERLGVVIYAHMLPENVYGMMLNENGRRFVAQHRLVE